jgi:xylan 1,4-beta-xylosidase
MYAFKWVVTWAVSIAALAQCGVAATQAPSGSVEILAIDANAQATPFPHFWEQTFGSGRAILSLRDIYRSDMREVKKATEFQYVRFHNILHDEVGVYDEDKNGNPVYNFSYVDQIYDGLLANGVRPFVEISFMPRKLASDPAASHPFWYKPNVTPPKDYAKWDGLIRAFAHHLIERYGVDEVAQWYFEVWNEPNIDFWAGVPKQSTYFELYDHTARALKAVNPRLRVGGPATAAADWIPEFLDHCTKQKVSLDFVSTHGYADDTVQNLFHTNADIPMDDRVCAAIKKVHGQIEASGRPKLPLMWTEWNVPSFGELHARDTIYVGPGLANDIRECDGLVTMMSWWTFDDTFEENGPSLRPFDGTFGLITAPGIKKPSYNAYTLLHRLGDERLANSATNAIVTRRKDGPLVIAVWNLVDPDKQGSAKTVRVDLRGMRAKTATVRRLDATHGNTLAAYDAMGKPRYPTEAQIRELNRAAELPPPEQLEINDGKITLELPVNALVILEVEK